MTEPTLFEIKGVDRRGVSVVTRCRISDLAVFVSRKFEQGWRELSVTGPSGTLVGSIERSVDDGQRTWWAEASHG